MEEAERRRPSAHAGDEPDEVTYFRQMPSARAEWRPSKATARCDPAAVSRRGLSLIGSEEGKSGFLENGRLPYTYHRPVSWRPPQPHEDGTMNDETTPRGRFLVIQKTGDAHPAENA